MMLKFIDYFAALVFWCAAGFTVVFTALCLGLWIVGIARTASQRLCWTVGIVGGIMLVSLLLAFFR